MICQKCQKENHKESKFCRFCGQKISRSRRNTNPVVDVKQVTRSITASFSNSKNFLTLKNKLLKNSTVVAVLFSLLIITGAYAAPKINGYIKINKAIESAKKAEDAKDYNNALSLIASVSDYWMTDSKKQEIENLKEKQNKYIKYKEIFNSALEKEQTKKLEEARKLLLTIDPEFPEYGDVKNKLTDIQDKIEGKLKADADREAAARASAERQTQIESESRAQAQRETQAATEAKQRSDAAAAIAAQAARDAEYRKQQADAAAAASAQAARESELKRQQEIFSKFVDEVVSIHNTIITGLNYMNDSIQYIRVGGEIRFTAINLQAQTIFNDALKRSGDLLLYSTPSGYESVGNNLRCAADNLSSSAYNYSKSMTSILSGEFSLSSSYSDSGGSYERQGRNCLNSVKSFLTQQGR